MEWTFYEKKCSIDGYEDGIHPGFKEINNNEMTAKVPSIFHWIRSTFISEEDLDEKEYIKNDFFERRKNIFEDNINNWEIKNIIGWYFNGKVYNDEKEAIDWLLSFKK